MGARVNGWLEGWMGYYMSNGRVLTDEFAKGRWVCRAGLLQNQWLRIVTKTKRIDSFWLIEGITHRRSLGELWQIRVHTCRCGCFKMGICLTSFNLWSKCKTCGIWMSCGSCMYIWWFRSTTHKQTTLSISALQCLNCIMMHLRSGTVCIDAKSQKAFDGQEMNF